MVYQIVPYGIGALLSKSQVGGIAFVAIHMALNSDLELMLLNDSGNTLELLKRRGCVLRIGGSKVTPWSVTGRLSVMIC